MVGKLGRKWAKVIWRFRRLEHKVVFHRRCEWFFDDELQKQNVLIAPRDSKGVLRTADITWSIDLYPWGDNTEKLKFLDERAQRISCYKRHRGKRMSYEIQLEEAVQRHPVLWQLYVWRKKQCDTCVVCLEQKSTLPSVAVE